jgi:phosphoribosylamine---glycine ligase
VVAQTQPQALDAIDQMLVRGRLGAAGARVVLEDFLPGEEASFIVMSDGQHALALATSQDHKRLLDADQGPNTGGMGAYSPAPVVTPELHARVMREIMLPAIAGMAAEGHVYTGFLYAGLMIGPDGEPRTLEFNCRLGDPEAQPILMRLQSDLVDLLVDAVDARLGRVEAQWDRRVALGVVVAAQGYPEGPRRGDPITSLPADAQDCIVFHAGTRMQQDRLVTDGGRVLCVTALGENVREARRRAYDAVSEVQFAGLQFRTDIGQRAIQREPE